MKVTAHSLVFIFLTFLSNTLFADSATTLSGTFEQKRIVTTWNNQSYNFDYEKTLQMLKTNPPTEDSGALFSGLEIKDGIIKIFELVFDKTNYAIEITETEMSKASFVGGILSEQLTENSSHKHTELLALDKNEIAIKIGADQGVVYIVFAPIEKSILEAHLKQLLNLNNSL